MPNLVVPLSLSTAQREDVLSAITRHAGGRVDLVDSNPNRLVFHRPSMPQHIFQGTEDIQSFAFESSVDLLEIPSAETLLGGLQEIKDMTALRDAVLKFPSDSAESSIEKYSAALAEYLVNSGFFSDAPHLIADALNAAFQSSSVLQYDAKMVVHHGQDLFQQRLAEALPHTLRDMGFKITQDPMLIKSQPQYVHIDSGSGIKPAILEGSDFRPAFGRYLETLIAHRTPEKIFIQKAHQYLYSQGIALDVGEQPYISAYQLSVLKPAASALLRHIYVAGSEHQRVAAYNRMVFVDKNVMRQPSSVSLVDYLDQKQNARWQELNAIFADGVSRLEFQKTPASVIQNYQGVWGAVQAEIENIDLPLNRRVELLDSAKNFLMTGGMFGSEARRLDDFSRASAQLQATMASSSSPALLSEANEKQAKWKQAYEKIVEQAPQDHQEDFSQAIDSIWDIACPSGKFVDGVKIEDVSAIYRKLLNDAPTVLNLKVMNAVTSALYEGRKAVDVVSESSALYHSLSGQYSVLEDALSAIKDLPKDAKPIELYNVLKQNIDVLRVTSAQLVQLIRQSEEYVKNKPEEIQSLPNSPYQLHSAESTNHNVPPAFLDVLSRAIEGADTCAPHPLTVDEMLENIKEIMVDDQDELMLPENFDTQSALDALQNAGVLSVVESIDARIRQFNEHKQQSHAIQQSDIAQLLSGMSDADRKTYSFYAQELNYWNSQVELLTNTQSENELQHRRDLTNALDKMKELEDSFIAFVDRATTVAPEYPKKSEEPVSVVPAPGVEHAVLADDGDVKQPVFLEQAGQNERIDVVEITRTETQEPIAEDISIPPAYTMSRKDWIDTNIRLSGYGDEVLKDPDLYEAQACVLRDEWVNGLKEQAKHTRIPYAVLDDYVAHYGITALQSEFRGIYEVGVGGYEPPRTRLWDKTYSQVLAMHKNGVLSDKKINNVRALHRYCIASALKEGFVIPDVVFAEYPEMREQQTVDSLAVKFIDDPERTPNVDSVPLTGSEQSGNKNSNVVAPQVDASDVENAMSVLKEDAVPDFLPERKAPLPTPEQPIVAFSDLSEITTDQHLRPLALTAAALLEQASERMFSQDELVLPDEESFLMEQYDRLIEKALEGRDLRVLERNLEEFKQLIAPIQTEKSRKRITEWFQHGFEINKVQSFLNEKIPSLSERAFSDLVESPTKLVALLSETFRQNSAGDNVFLLQTISETALIQLQERFESECLKSMQKLGILADENHPESISEANARIERRKDLLKNLVDYQETRSLVRKTALESKENSMAVGSCWANIHKNGGFGEPGYFTAIREFKEVLKTPDAFELMKQEVAPDLAQVDYLLSTKEPGVKEVSAEPKTLQKRRSYNDDMDGDDFVDQSAPSIPERRMRV